MTLSHGSNRLYSNPDYKQGGFTPFKFQAGITGLGDTGDVLGGASPDQISASQVENFYATNPLLNPNSVQSLFSGSSGTLLIGLGILAGILLIKGNR